MTDHIMIDIETMGVGSFVPMFEIGVCAFNMEEMRITGSRQIHLDLLDVIMRTGFAPQRDTIDWWRKQDYDPSAYSGVAHSLKDGLTVLTDVITKNMSENGMVWANSPSFDLVILEQHYAAMSMPKPWNFRQEADFRTVKWMHQNSGFGKIDVVNATVHNAESDAIAQAEALWLMMEELNSA